MDARDTEAAALLAELLVEVRALRVEVVRQTEVLEAVLRRLESLERTQYS